MTNQKFRCGMALVLAFMLALGCVLTGCSSGGDSAANPAELGSASNFNRWFSEKGGKSLANLETAGTYYFKLTKDLELKDNGVIGKGHTVTIDLNGFTITNKEGSLVQAFRVTEGASLTLVGGKIEMAGADANGGLITVEGAGSALHLKDVTLTNKDDSGITAKTHNGGVIYATSPVEDVENPAIVTMQGQTVINGSAAGNRVSGGAVSVEGGSRFYMYGGTIQNGFAGGGGNVNLDDQAHFYMHGGTIVGGKTEKNTRYNGSGGNVAIMASSRFWLYGGSIEAGHAGKNGGNVLLSSYGNVEAEDGLHILGGEIKSGTAATNGGNVFATETGSVVHLYGGKVSDGEAYCGGNIYLEAAGLVMKGGTLTGLQTSDINDMGGNVFAVGGVVDLYDGLVEKGRTNTSGSNIYVMDSVVNLYGGTIAEGVSAAKAVNHGGANLYASGESVVNLYDCVIRDGVVNINKENVAAAGPNVMLAGKATMHMFDGEILHGQVYGNVGRAGGVYAYGQVSGSRCVFHMYGGLIENDLLCDGTFEGELMRGMGIGAYSMSGGGADPKTDGLGFARIFEGTINYLGPDDSTDKWHMLYSNRSKNPNTLFIFDEDIDPKLTRGATFGACKDASHNTEVETIAATCVTQGCTKYTCNSCGDWYKVTAPATGHTEVADTVIAATDLECGYTQHTCASCNSTWYSDVTSAGAAGQTEAAPATEATEG